MSTFNKATRIVEKIRQLTRNCRCTNCHKSCIECVECEDCMTKLVASVEKVIERG